MDARQKDLDGIVEWALELKFGRDCFTEVSRQAEISPYHIKCFCVQLTERQFNDGITFNRCRYFIRPFELDPISLVMWNYINYLRPPIRFRPPAKSPQEIILIKKVVDSFEIPAIALDFSDGFSQKRPFTIASGIFGGVWLFLSYCAGKHP